MCVSMLLDIKSLVKVAFTSLFFAVVSAEPPAEPRQVWIFGDSQSDNGNLSILLANDGIDDTFLADEPYIPYMPTGVAEDLITLQRITTGPTVAEIIAASCFGGNQVSLPSLLVSVVGPLAANNYAVAGALVDTTSPEDFPDQVARLTFPLDLAYQIRRFAANTAEGGIIQPDDVAIVALGGNDAFRAWQATLEGGGDVSIGFAFIDRAVDTLRAFTAGSGGFVPLVDAIEDDVPSLSELGIDEFVFFQIPNLGLTPFVRGIAATAPSPGDVLDLATAMSDYFNVKLVTLVNEIQLKGYTVTVVPTERATRSVYQEFQDFGFANGLDACFLLNPLLLGAAPGVFNEGCTNETVESYLWVDPIHGTGNFYRIVAELAMQELECQAKTDEEMPSKDDATKSSSKVMTGVKMSKSSMTMMKSYKSIMSSKSSEKMMRRKQMMMTMIRKGKGFR